MFRVLSCVLCHVITDVSMVLATHVPRMHWITTQGIKLIGRGICHTYFHVGKMAESLCCLVSLASLGVRGM